MAAASVWHPSAPACCHGWQCAVRRLRCRRAHQVRREIKAVTGVLIAPKPMCLRGHTGSEQVSNSQRRLVQGIQRLLETVGVRALGLGQRLKPVGDLIKALVAGRFRHPWVHIGVLVGLAGDGGFQI